MKLSDLNKITIKDLKNYDWKGLTNRLLGDPWPLYCIGAGIAAFIVVSFAMKSYKNMQVTKRTEIQKLQSQVDAVRSFQLIDDEYKKFWSSIPEYLPESKLVEMLSEFALKHNVQIISFSPPKEADRGNVNIKSVEITIAAEDYANAVRFMHDIENSKYSIRAGNWSGQLASPNRRSRRGSRVVDQYSTKAVAKSKYLEASIAIETVEFKNE